LVKKGFPSGNAFFNGEEWQLVIKIYSEEGKNDIRK